MRSRRTSKLIPHPERAGQRPNPQHQSHSHSENRECGGPGTIQSTRGYLFPRKFDSMQLMCHRARKKWVPHSFL